MGFYDTYLVDGYLLTDEADLISSDAVDRFSNNVTELWNRGRLMLGSFIVFCEVCSCSLGVDQRTGAMTGGITNSVRICIC